MRLNIAHKILGVVGIVLAFMLAVAVYSIHLTSEISDELESVANKHLPVSEAVSRINVNVLEQGISLQRLFVLEKTDAADQSTFVDLGSATKSEFQTVKDLLKPVGQTKPHTIKAMSVLAEDVAAIERDYLAFEAHGLLLLDKREQGAQSEFVSLFLKLNTLQDKANSSVATLRAHVQDLTNRAVERSAKNERYLLVANSLLTVLAAVVGLGVAVLIIRSLVNNIRNLVSGTEAVESGDLDTEVQVKTTDEIGQLTQSFNHMTGELRLKERIKETFGKYIDPRIVSNLLDHPEFSEPGGERREMTVMFIDLKGFTSISEKLNPDDLVSMINMFFGRMTEAISQNKGVVDKFMGDAVSWRPKAQTAH